MESSEGEEEKRCGWEKGRRAREKARGEGKGKVGRREEGGWVEERGRVVKGRKKRRGDVDGRKKEGQGES